MKRLLLYIIFVLCVGWIIFMTNEAKISTYLQKLFFFTIVVMPDTQVYAEKHPDIFCSQSQWIVENKNRRRIVFVSQVGDLVQNGGKSDAEWQVASTCFSILEGKVPYAVVPGNNDADDEGSSHVTLDKYNNTFPPQRFSQYPWYKGNFKHNQNSYQVLDVWPWKLLFINLEFDPPDDVIQWANKILEENQTRQAILSTHIYLEDDSGVRTKHPYLRTQGNSGEDIWERLVKHNCNIILVLSGHSHRTDGESSRTDINACNKPVYQITQDYQGRERGGNGLLRMYTIFPFANKINVETYSPYVNQFEVDNDSSFSLFL